MFRFILRRLLVTLPLVLVVVTLTWGLIRLAPGNFYSSEKKLPRFCSSTPDSGSTTQAPKSK